MKNISLELLVKALKERTPTKIDECDREKVRKIINDNVDTILDAIFYDCRSNITLDKKIESSNLIKTMLEIEPNLNISILERQEILSDYNYGNPINYNDVKSIDDLIGNYYM